MMFSLTQNLQKRVKVFQTHFKSPEFADLSTAKITQLSQLREGKFGLAFINERIMLCQGA
jgi:hypothetical protein